MKSSKKHLTLRIAELKKAIRHKYNSFKTGAVEAEKFFEKKYKPIISEIKKSNLNSKRNTTIKMEPKKEEEDEEDEEEEEKEEEPEEFTPQAGSSPVIEDESHLDSLLSTPGGIDTVSQYINEHFTHPVTKKYMDMFMKDRGGRYAVIDHSYGPYFNSDTLMVGDKKLDFKDNGSIMIGKVTYKASKGLYELLFKRVPDEDEYNDSDLKAYKDILLKSNAHKKGYEFTGKVNRNTSLKYKNIISKLFPTSEIKGSGMQWKSTQSRDIVHWDDPNELVDRLRLLAMSTETGNTSHANEIINIVEELREAGYIKGSGNKTFETLLK